jgi:hypothetical protein
VLNIHNILSSEAIVTQAIHCDIFSSWLEARVPRPAQALQDTERYEKGTIDLSMRFIDEYPFCVDMAYQDGLESVPISFVHVSAMIQEAGK